MLPAIGTAGHKYVIKVSGLSFEDAHLAGGENVVYVVADWIGNDRSTDVVMSGARGRRPGTADCIAHSLPRETVIIGALHTDDR